MPWAPRRPRPAALILAWFGGVHPAHATRRGLLTRDRGSPQGFFAKNLLPNLSDVLDPCGNRGTKDERLQQVQNVDESVQDFERRVKPPFVSIPGQEADGRLTAQQLEGVAGIFDTNPEDFRDCVLVHMYAEPLEVIDALHVADALKGNLTKEGPDGEQEGAEEVLCRPGLIFDDTTEDKDGYQEHHVSTDMIARLEGITNPVQVIPHGNMKTWHSLWKVPLGGFLCLNAGFSDSAPVLYSLPTPCVPTTMDAAGNALDPTDDSYEVWVGSTRLAFPNKSAAEEVCLGFVDEVGVNLEVVDWDADFVKDYFTQQDVLAKKEGRSLMQPTLKADTVSGRIPDAHAAQGAAAQDAREAPPRRTPQRPAQDAPEALPSPYSAPDAAMLAPAARDVAASMANLITPMSPSLPQFLKLAAQRDGAQGWTMGNKRMLVVIMDWKRGDRTLQPYSRQAKNPASLYKTKIVPEAIKALREMSYGQLQITADVIPETVFYTHERIKMVGRLPFPTLYDRARDAVQGHPKWGKKYRFKDYNFVFVMAPQVKPVGTKGVAWVGSRGAMCNGCETVSDSHKIMVMVHELGHNLGLSHASSEGLDYGNLFDWMGNSPDVSGHNYGLGYVLELGWISPANIFQVTDKTLAAVNDLVTLTPYDLRKPSARQVVGVKISLGKNSDDIYVSYRAKVASEHRGVYITYQDKTSPNSRLMDAACHTLSQQDAHMQKGWLFIDDSQSVVVSVIDVQNKYAKVQIWKTPARADNIAKIRMRKGFTDGRTKCPVTCQDSDFIMSYTCAELKKKGYCSKNAKITVQGQKMQISTELCPQTCNMCKHIYDSTPLEMKKKSCADKQVRISGMDCAQMAKKDMCGMKTSAGKHVGRDFCPRSCGRCPKEPPPPPKSAGWQTDPKPARAVGFVEQEADETAPPGGLKNASAAAAAEADNASALSATQALAIEGLEASRSEQPSPRNGTGAAHPAAAGEAGCEDDPLWTDVDGASCQVYASSIEKMGLEEVCRKHNGGEGSLHCRKTCKTCNGAGGRCSDNVCIEAWMEKLGVCYQCADFAKMCFDPEARDVFVQECPLTCGVCKDDSANAEDINFHYNSTARNYTDSVKYCDSKGFVIASIRSEHEQEQVEGIVKNGSALAVYLGGTSDGDGKWKWEDGSPWLYEHPVHDGLRGTKERHMAMSHRGRWHDTSGEDKFGVICREKTPPCKDDDPEFCQNLGMDYCTNLPFQERCKRTCALCSDAAPVKQDCQDAFDLFTCTRYKMYGWCDREDTKEQVRHNCKLTCGHCDANENKGVLGKLGHLRRKLCNTHRMREAAIPLPVDTEVKRAKKNAEYVSSWLPDASVRASPPCPLTSAAVALTAFFLLQPTPA